MSLPTKALTTTLGITVVGIAGYLIYLLFKSDEDDDYNNTIPRAGKHKIVHVGVPKGVVGALIGRNGSNIKKIQDESNTRINTKDLENNPEKIFVISGSAEGCIMAENLIRDFVRNQPMVECFDMEVPHRCVGKIIGRCGEQIQEISSLSGAKINFANDDKSAAMRRLFIRGTKEQINLAKAYIEDIINKFDSVHKKMENSLAKREPRAPAKNGGVINSVESPKVERISPLPGQPDSQFDVYVSAMIDPSHFWVQLVSPKATELDQLVEDMTEYYSKKDNRDFHILDNLQPGDLVAALFKYDNKWYRAEVLKIHNSQVELYYVDYGDTDTTECSDAYELRTDFLQLHFQAIECYLGRVEPTEGSWSEEAVDKFEEWTHVAQWKKLSAKINGYTVREKVRAKREGSPVPGVELFDVSNDQDRNIGEELVRHGYAVFKKEEMGSRATSMSNVSLESC
ncbi:tudor and KH domain-containing protein homolog [Onthophagus taurus]|uniref:tudor and KH domain-containing protein homolog n=1 Tax=Onthophagus taurus TaxID=166361 RepID=UPI000C208A83|nr:tudor and KH domain-containing protein homolog [Onthophagus taurus]